MSFKGLILNLIAPGRSLSDSAVRSGFWALLTRAAQQVFGLIKIAILARLLAPNDFGTMGFALLTMSALETFSQTGFQSALIQKQGEIEAHLDVTWTFLVLRAILLFLIMYCLAPYVAAFFAAPPVEGLVRFIGVSMLLGSLTNIGVIYFQKDLQFNKLLVYQFSVTLADFVVAVVSAFIFRDVWALAFGYLAANVVGVVVSYLIHPYRPRISFDFSVAGQMFGFGKWVLGSSIIVYLTTQSDGVFVGKVLGPAALGFYQMAQKVANLPATEITHVISQVTFPVYSRLQSDAERLRVAYLKISQVITLIAAFVAAIVFVLASEITLVFLGDKWMPMVQALRILSLAGFLRAISANAGYVFYASGKPGIDTKLQMLRLFVLVVFIYPLTMRWGITGAAVAVCLSVSVSFIAYAVEAVRITRCGWFSYFSTMMLPVMSGIAMSVSLVMTKEHVARDFWGVLLLCAFGTSVYLIVAGVLDRYINQRRIYFLFRQSFKAVVPV